MNVPQTLVGATANYHPRARFDGGLRFNYGSSADNTIWNSPNYRPNVNGKLQSYSAFFGRSGRFHPLGARSVHGRPLLLAERNSDLAALAAVLPREHTRDFTRVTTKAFFSLCYCPMEPLRWTR